MMQSFLFRCAHNTTCAQGLKRTTPRTHACQVKVQKKKSTRLNFGDLVDHPPLHPGYLHKIFYPLTASLSLFYCTKISEPSSQTNFLANIGFSNRITFFFSFFSQFLPDHLLLFLFVFSHLPLPGPLPQHVKDNITPLVYEQLLIAQNVLECAISTSTSTSASNIEEVSPSQPDRVVTIQFYQGLDLVADRCKN